MIRKSLQSKYLKTIFNIFLSNKKPKKRPSKDRIGSTQDAYIYT
jgi:hypothetical protein